MTKNVDISIIMPVLNEESTLEATLLSVVEIADCECIVVDGGSSDDTLSIASSYGCKIVSSPRGRGKQMNVGAKIASGELLLFLHGDTLLPADFVGSIKNTLGNQTVAAGAFSLGLDNTRPSLRFIVWMANVRSRLLQLPYGDQAIFTRASTFSSIGGYPEMEIMEDFVFVKHLSRRGKIITLKQKVISSARRWEKLGVIRTTVINQLIVVGYLIGISPKTLSNLYRKSASKG